MVMIITQIDDDHLASLRGIDWSERLKASLKAELKVRNIGYAELARRLGVMGIEESERNLANKISRGGFSAVFFVQCLMAIGSQSFALS